MAKKSTIFSLLLLLAAAAWAQGNKNQREVETNFELNPYLRLSHDYQLRLGAGASASWAMPYNHHFRYGFDVTGTIGDQTVAPSLMGTFSYRTGGEFFGEFSVRGGVAEVIEEVVYQGQVFKVTSEAVYLLPSAEVTLKAGYRLGNWNLNAGVGFGYRFGVDDQPTPKVDGFQVAEVNRSAWDIFTFIGASCAISDKTRICGDHPFRLAVGYGSTNQGNLISVEVFKYNRTGAHWGRNIGLEFSETFGEVYTKSMGLLKFGYQYQLFGADTWLIPSANLGLGIGEGETKYGFHQQNEAGKADFKQKTIKPGLALMGELKLELNLKKLFGVEGVALWAKAQLSYVQPFKNQFVDCGDETHESFFNQWTEGVTFGGTIAF